MPSCTANQPRGFIASVLWASMATCLLVWYRAVYVRQVNGPPVSFDRWLKTRGGEEW